MGNLAPSLNLWYPEDFFAPSETRRAESLGPMSWKRGLQDELSPPLREPTPDDVLHVSYINCDFTVCTI